MTTVLQLRPDTGSDFSCAESRTLIEQGSGDIGRKMRGEMRQMEGGR